MKNKTQLRRNSFQAALPHTLPVFAGYTFLAIAYGLMMHVNGFPVWAAPLIALTVYGGSLEYVIVTLLVSSFAPLETFLIAIMIQARHLFYGIAMLGKYRNIGLKKWYMIYTLSDETFAINSSTVIPDNVDAGWFYFFVSFLDQMYWVFGAFLGGVIGNLITFNTTGLDFVMTAMFVVIFLDALLRERHHSTAYIGLFASLLCLALFGPSSFLIPTMLCILILLSVFRKPIEAQEETK